MTLPRFYPVLDSADWVARAVSMSVRLVQLRIKDSDDDALRADIARARDMARAMPGLVFLLVFQVFIFGYTAYIAFTNYGTGHVGTQEQAVEAALIQGERRIDGSSDYPLSIVQRGGELGFAIVDDDGDVQVGSATEPLTTASDAEIGTTGAPDRWAAISAPGA